jgi:hypothetical protein
MSDSCLYYYACTPARAYRITVWHIHALLYPQESDHDHFMPLGPWLYLYTPNTTAAEEESQEVLHYWQALLTPTADLRDQV